MLNLAGSGSLFFCRKTGFATNVFCTMTEDYYQVLGVSYDASEEEIKKVYRDLAKQYHPDINQGDTVKEDRFKLISEAYNTLSNKEKRSSYDFWLLYQLSEHNDDSSSYDTWRYDEPIWPRYKPHRREPVTYSKHTYITATILVFVVFLSIFLIPVFLVKYSSVFHYEEAVESYKQGNFYSALNSLDHAILDFGDRTPEACLLTSVILMEQYAQYNEAIKYAEIGIDHTESPALHVKLLYLKGKALKENGAYRLSIETFAEAMKLWPDTDKNQSSLNIRENQYKKIMFEPVIVQELTEEKLLYATGEIYAFFQNDYPRAITCFNELISAGEVMPEAFYGRGYCFYKMNNNIAAISDFDAYLNHQPLNDMAYYFRGMSKLQTGQRTAACQDFAQAQSLDNQEGKRMHERHCP